MKPRISLITLGVSDLARARRFYEEGLGLEKLAEGDEGVAFYDMGGTWLALWPRQELAKDAGVELEGSSYPAISIAHNLTTREAVDRLVDQAVAAGAELVKKPQDTFYGGYAGYFADTEGFLWEIAWNPFIPQLASEP